LVSSLTSAYPSYSFFRAGQYLIAIFVIGYLLEELPDEKTLLKALYLFSIVNLCYVALAYAFVPKIVLGAEEGRLSGGGIFKSDYGGVPFVASMFSFCYFLYLKNRWWRSIHLCIFILSIVFLFLYQTRNVLYPAPFLLLFILYYYNKISFRSFFLLFLTVSIILFLNYIGVPLFDLFTRKKGFTARSRVDTWEVVMENIHEVPFFGLGFLGTPAFLLPIKESLVGTKILITADPHNYFLTAYMEFGILGFLYSTVFIFILIKLIVRSWKVSAALPGSILFPGLFAIIAQGIISSFIANSFISQISFNMLSVITCILLLAKMTPECERTPSARTIKRIRVGW